MTREAPLQRPARRGGREAPAPWGAGRPIDIIEPANVRYIALGLKRGGVIDPSLPGTDPGDVVIVHDLRGLA